MKRQIFAILLYISSLVVCNSQTTNDFDEFRKGILTQFSQERSSIKDDYKSFRNSINADYANFLRNAWSNLTAFAPINKPKENDPIPPVEYDEEYRTDPVVVKPKPIKTPKPDVSPKPISPIEENEQSIDKISINFYGLEIPVRIPKDLNKSTRSDEEDIASTWSQFSDGRYENSLVDLLSIKESKQLSDWAFLQLTEKFASENHSDYNTSSLLTAWILCQSGFQIRLARDDNKVSVLFASNHIIYDKSYYIVDGMKYYPLYDDVSTLKICNVTFKGETPLSLEIKKEQKFGLNMSDVRRLHSAKYSDFIGTSSVNRNLIEFYNSFPTSSIGKNPLTRWAIYANTPFDTETSSNLYTQLKASISGCTKLEAAERLLNWVQTGFEYEYDDKVWGHDRAFFAEESLYYPYCDCEDRSILFSHLVRDLLGLDVALIYYPGHLATAVCFNEDFAGDTMLIDGRKFLVCDPTFIGAPVGRQMPDLEYEKAQAIILQR